MSSMHNCPRVSASVTLEFDVRCPICRTVARFQVCFCKLYSIFCFNHLESKDLLDLSCCDSVWFYVSWLLWERDKSASSSLLREHSKRRQRRKNCVSRLKSLQKRSKTTRILPSLRKTRSWSKQGRVFLRLDVDGSGTLDEEEFVSCWRVIVLDDKFGPEQSEDDLRECFRLREREREKWFV